MNGKKVLELDDDGCPTNETLEYIKNCNVTNPIECDALMTDISTIWNNPELCKKNKHGNWEVHTDGLPGNESIIAALRSNDVFWRIYWLQTTRTVNGMSFVFGRNITDLDYREKELEAIVEQLIAIGDWAITGMTIASSYSSSGMKDLAEKQRDEWNALIKKWREIDK